MNCKECGDLLRAKRIERAGDGLLIVYPCTRCGVVESRPPRAR